MQATHYLSIAIRLFAIFLVATSISQFGMLLEALANDGKVGFASISYPLQVLNTALPLIVAFGLWIFPTFVAQKIVKPEFDKPVEPIKPEAILTVLAVSLGLFVLSSAVPSVLYWSTYVGMTQQSHYGEPILSIGKEGVASIVASVAELFVGLALVLKGRTLSRFLLRIAR